MADGKMSSEGKGRNDHPKILFTLILVTSVIVAITGLSWLGAFDFFEKKLLDFRFLTFNQNNPVSEDIVYLDIDEESLNNLSESFGGWPWPRGTLISDLITEYVMSGEPSIFLFDVMYTQLSSKTPDIDVGDEDWIMTESALYWGEKISHAVLFGNDPTLDSVKPLPDSVAYNFEISVDDSASQIEWEPLNTFSLPYDPLYPNAGQLHSVTHVKDSDGISRRNKLAVYYDNAYYPSLALVGLQTKLGLSNYRIEGTTFFMTTADGVELAVPLDESGNYQVNFYKNWQEIASTVSDNVVVSRYGQLYQQPENILVETDFFKDKIVVFGASAAALFDLKVTPMGDDYPGPFMHITTISNILMDQHLSHMPMWLETLILIASVLLISLSILYIKIRLLRIFAGLSVLLIHTILGLVLFKTMGIITAMTADLVALVISYFGSILYLSLTEEAEKKKISNAMSKYLAPSVMKEVLENYTNLIGEVGEKKDLTILFSDIRGFTTISEGYPAETVVSVLNRYLERMINIVFDNLGTVDKFIGDAVMAFWGAPRDDEDRHIHAVKAALSMIREVETFNHELQSETNVPDIRIGIGINTGEMIVGNIGSEKRLDYTVIGDNVNLGSRLEGLTKHYGVPIIVSGTTYEKTLDDFHYLFVDQVAVKGKKEAVPIYYPMIQKSSSTNIAAGIDTDTVIEEKVKKEIEFFDRGHQLYFDQNFKEGQKIFADGAQNLKYLKGLSTLYQKRCEYYLKKPPGENWNKVWKMLEK